MHIIANISDNQNPQLMVLVPQTDECLVNGINSTNQTPLDIKNVQYVAPIIMPLVFFGT